MPRQREVKPNRWGESRHLKPTDEIKFVIGTVEDYDWAKQQIAARKLEAICPLLFRGRSAAAPGSGIKSLKPAPSRADAGSRGTSPKKIIADGVAGAVPGATAQNHLADGAAQGVKNRKSECRNPERNPKSDIRNVKVTRSFFGLRFRSSFEHRISDFGFSHHERTGKVLDQCAPMNRAT